MLFSHVTQNGVKLYNFDISELQNHTIGVDNKVYNNIVDNIKNAVVDSSFSYPLNPSRNGTDVVLWDNGLVGNYWSDYDGQGTHVIGENNVEYHPLTQQVEICATASAPLPIAFLAIIVVVVGVGAGLLVYFKKRSRDKSSQSGKRLLVC
jgi:hypothetical protein